MKFENSNIVAIIPARGGSKGIPKKNIMQFCGKPLISWTINQALNSKYVSEAYVSTEDKEIMNISKEFGAKIIWRPQRLAKDTSSSDDALLHAIKQIEKTRKIDIVVFLQATSPLREAEDINKAIEKFYLEDADSLFSGALLDDCCIWEIGEIEMKSLTFDYKNRGRRQDRKPYFLENGSIYIFKPDIIRQYNNRLGGRILIFEMPFWKSYEIDNLDDLEVCEYFLRKNILRDLP